MCSQKSCIVTGRIFVVSLMIFLLPALLASQSLTLSVADTSAAANSLVKIPIQTTDVTGLGIRSIDITMTFDEKVLDALGANSLGSISESWGNPLTTDEPGKIRLVMVGVTDLVGEGVLTYLFFDVLGSENDTTSVYLHDVRINDGMIATEVVPGNFTALMREADPSLVLSFPDTSADVGSIIELPLRVTKRTSFAIDSLRLTLTYSKYVTTALAVVTEGTLTESWIDTVATLLPGKLSIFLKGAPALSDSGVLCKIRFQLIGSPGMATPIHFQGIRIYQDSLKFKTRNGKINIQGGTASDVTVSIPDISADSSAIVTVPVFISDVTNKGVQSASIDVTYDTTVLNYQNYSKTNTLMESWFLFANPSQGRIRFGCSSLGVDLTGQGILIELIFDVIGEPGMQTALHFQTMELNEGNPTVQALDGLFTVNYVIPVELVSLSATLEQNSVVLTWATVSETNNFGFEIERKAIHSDWQKIGFVTGHGTTTIAQRYWFQDKKIAPGHYSYRLKQVDFDGTANYSGTVDIMVANPGQFQLFQNYPNPFNAETKIEFELPTPGKINLIIYDILGREIEKIDLGEFDPGRHHFTFDAENLSTGMYFYKLKSGNFSDIKKLLILK